jgi:hypothetical protein
MVRELGLLAVLAICQGVSAAAGLPEDDYRGGWETFGQQASHILEFSIRGSQVRGIDCTSCSDATTLAFVDGTLSPKALRFTITHVNDDGSTAYQDHATATLNHGQLSVDGVSGAAGSARFHYLMRKDPRGPAPLPGGPVGRLPAGAVVAPVHIPPNTTPPIPPGLWAHRICQYLEPRTCPYESPTAPEMLSADRIVGVWVGLRDGPGKQFFVIRRVGQTLRGMACGPCDNPYTMATLGDFQIDGDTLRFNILHEDWGRPGFIPFHNQITAQVADNEMRIINVPDRGPRPAGAAASSGAAEGRARAAAGGNTLFGPIAIEATRGNHTP